VKFEPGTAEYHSLESYLMSALSEEITREIDEELLQSMGLRRLAKAQRYFYFQDVNEALRFKLTWGGGE
jgi:hypothetical protein